MHRHPGNCREINVPHVRTQAIRATRPAAPSNTTVRAYLAKGSTYSAHLQQKKNTLNTKKRDTAQMFHQPQCTNPRDFTATATTPHTVPPHKIHTRKCASTLHTSTTLCLTRESLRVTMLFFAHARVSTTQLAGGTIHRACLKRPKAQQAGRASASLVIMCAHMAQPQRFSSIWFDRADR